MPDRSRTFTVSGVVLRQRALGEKDRIVIVYSRENGKISCVAKGARQPSSRLASLSQPLTHARFTLARGKTFCIITQGLVLDSFLNLKQDLFRLAVATCALELLEKSVAEGDAAVEVCDLLLDALKAIESGMDAEMLLRAFEVKLLTLLGYQPVLEHCARCEAPLSNLIRTSRRFLFSPPIGGIICPTCRSRQQGGLLLSGVTVQAMLALRNASFNMLQQIRCTPQSAQEMRRVLEDFVRYRLDIDLRSRKFLDEIRPTIPVGERP